MNFGLISRSIKLAFEVTIFVLLTVYLVVEKEAPSREVLFAVWFLYFILCSNSIDSSIFKGTREQIEGIRLKMEDDGLKFNYSDIKGITNVIEKASCEEDYEISVESKDEEHFMIEIERI